MTDNWRTTLGNRYADQFDGRPFHFAVGDGWRGLLEEVFRRVDATLTEEEKTFFEWSDIKEKFGSIRMTHHGPDSVDDIVEWAEEASTRICERCGGGGRMRSEGGWARVRCDPCDRER